MNRTEALDIVKEYVKNRNLINHMLCVEAAMQFYAEKMNQDVEKWGVTGLLHDFDWEIHPTLEEHPQKGAPILRERGVPEEVIRAILSHAYHTGVPRESSMEKALFACDEVTGLITAVALVRPSKSLYDLEMVYFFLIHILQSVLLSNCRRCSFVQSLIANINML